MLTSTGAARRRARSMYTFPGGDASCAALLAATGRAAPLLERSCVSRGPASAACVAAAARGGRLSVADAADADASEVSDGCGIRRARYGGH